MIKNAKDAGADNSTPSVPQYFSWINSTNEGSTEEQTLVNLDFFRMMKETYGMQIRIYAWDAGNFDGASEGYGSLDSEKFRSQYPEGYKNVVAKAKELGIRFGLWGSPDGFGDDEKTEKERFDFFVHLCRDYNFALFKLDGVCGQLRKEKAELFAQMLKECRRYSPDLIVLNHRLNLYEAEPYVTTFLWNGEETYTDVFAHNKKTGMHNRVYAFSRGHVDGLNRLAEDHGVCLSSSLDYFEDDLVYQAFGRCLILSPEIYGNPWFLKDSEYPRLAYIYNLHGRYAPILVNGLRLPDEYGCNAVSRGDDTHRFICTGNDCWEKKTIKVKPADAGIKTDKKVKVILRFPFVSYLGEINADEEINIDLLPFRACIIELAEDGKEGKYLDIGEYEVIREDKDGTCLEYKEYVREKEPLFMGSLAQGNADRDLALRLYENAMFAVNNDSLEARCILRSGETEIPEAKKAREAFFGQKTYKLRGCENRNLFDGNPDTFFDAQSRSYCDGFRIDGGCLRIDAGAVIDADTVEIECFAADEETAEVKKQVIPAKAFVSSDLIRWEETSPAEVRTTAENHEQEIVKFRVHTTYMLKGKKITAAYKTAGAFRYMKLNEPMDRIYGIRFLKDGREVTPVKPFANNLMAPAEKRELKSLKCGSFVIPDYEEGDYIAVAVEGDHGAEKVYCAAEAGGKLMGFPGRAPTYRANIWEHLVCTENLNNTFYLPVPADMKGKEIKIYTMFYDEGKENIPVNVYLCGKHN